MFLTAAATTFFIAGFFLAIALLFWLTFAAGFLNLAAAFLAAREGFLAETDGFLAETEGFLAETEGFRAATDCFRRGAILINFFLRIARCCVVIATVENVKQRSNKEVLFIEMHEHVQILLHGSMPRATLPNARAKLQDWKDASELHVQSQVRLLDALGNRKDQEECRIEPMHEPRTSN